MPALKSVLLYGQDSHVSETRKLLLETGGYQVYVALNSPEALQYVVSFHIDILILCHTVPFESAETFLLVARALQPSAKTLLLATATRTHHQRRGDEVHDTSDGPAKFLEKIKTMATIAQHSDGAPNPSSFEYMCHQAKHDQQHSLCDE